MTAISELKPCPTCGRVCACSTGTVSSISAMPDPCRVCGGSGTVWRDDEPYTCIRCEGTGWDTLLEGCCDCGEEHEPEPPEEPEDG